MSNKFIRNDYQVIKTSNKVNIPSRVRITVSEKHEGVS
jgi:hypothetical protein